MNKNEIVIKGIILPPDFSEDNTTKVPENEKTKAQVSAVIQTIASAKNLKDLKDIKDIKDIIGSEYEEGISEREGLYYDAALACGLLTDALKEASSEEKSFSLPFIFAAQPDGFKGGDSEEDRILLGIMYWFFYACAASACPNMEFLPDSKDAENTADPENIIDSKNTKAPQNTEDTFRIPHMAEVLINDIVSQCDSGLTPEEFKDAEVQYTHWLEKMILRIREDGAEGMELFFLLREKMKDTCQDLFPAVLNNCLVRAFYIFCRFKEEAGKNEHNKFSDIFTPDLDTILPEDRRILTNMCIISADVFAAVNAALLQSDIVTE